MLWTGLLRKTLCFVILRMIKHFSCQNLSVSAPASSTDGSTALGINRLQLMAGINRGNMKQVFPPHTQWNKVKVYSLFLFILSSQQIHYFMKIKKNKIKIFSFVFGHFGGAGGTFIFGLCPFSHKTKIWGQGEVLQWDRRGLCWLPVCSPQCRVGNVLWSPALLCLPRASAFWCHAHMSVILWCVCTHNNQHAVFMCGCMLGEHSVLQEILHCNIYYERTVMQTSLGRNHAFIQQFKMTNFHT